MINFKGDVFAVAICFAGLSLIKVISSVILTRILYPEAYGIVTILVSIAFLMEMISDIGIQGLMVRDARADQPSFINTLWTIRLLRGVLNCVLLFGLAPLLADLYDTPALKDSLRIFSFWFVIRGMESMSFILAVRRQRARIVSYSELTATATSTLFVVIFSYYSRDHYGMIYGLLVNRALMAIASYFFYRELWPRFELNRDVLKAAFGFGKYVLPSSIVSILLTQYDKFIFLKLFSINLFGLYGLAGNMSGPIDTLVTRMSRAILFPRFAENYRRRPERVRESYYSDNRKLMLLITSLPAVMAGASHLIVEVLYDDRYLYAAVILQAFAIRSMIASLAAPAENILVATGTPRPVLVGNMLRLTWLVPASLIGYYFWGFDGFLYAAMLEGAPALVYYIWLQHRRSLLVPKYEGFRVAYMVTVFLVSWTISAGALEFVKEFG